MGYFLRAYLHFETVDLGLCLEDDAQRHEVLHQVQRILLQHKKHILETSVSSFAGLPELTNKDGLSCADSCPTQAWSMATLLETVWDLKRIAEKKPGLGKML